MTKLNREYRRDAKHDIQEAARSIRKYGGVDRCVAKLVTRECQLQEVSLLSNEVCRSSSHQCRATHPLQFTTLYNSNLIRMTEADRVTFGELLETSTDALALLRRYVEGARTRFDECNGVLRVLDRSSVCTVTPLHSPPLTFRLRGRSVALWLR